MTSHRFMSDPTLEVYHFYHLLPACYQNSCPLVVSRISVDQPARTHVLKVSRVVSLYGCFVIVKACAYVRRIPSHGFNLRRVDAIMRRLIESGGSRSSGVALKSFLRMCSCFWPGCVTVALQPRWSRASQAPTSCRGFAEVALRSHCGCAAVALKSFYEDALVALAVTPK